MNKKRDSFLPGCRSWTNANEKLTKFVDEDEQKERPKDVMNLLQCQPVDNILSQTSFVIAVQKERANVVLRFIPIPF